MDMTERPPEPMEGIENLSNEAEVLVGQESPPRLMITKMVNSSFDRLWSRSLFFLVSH
jgi:hypothetical protein